jgi:hypothetical protein
MKKRIRYTDEPIKLGRTVPDFLPKPEDLVSRESNVRVTLNLSSRSLTFFRNLSKRSHVPYQKLIRRYLDDFAQNATQKA